METRSNFFKVVNWFLIANIVTLIPVAIIGGRGFLIYGIFIFLITSAISFFGLLFSKYGVKEHFKIRIISENNFNKPEEKKLYELVNSLRIKAGLQKMPEVGIYESPEMNAFAAGFNKNHALIAFSTGILGELDHEGLAGVTAHEISHIANGDMTVMSILHSSLNSMIFVLLSPLYLLRLILYWAIEDSASLFYFTIYNGIVSFLKTILLFITNLIAKFYSRHREFKADFFAAKLTNKDFIASALKKLTENPISSKSDSQYSEFKINSSPAFLDMLSDHPSLARRIDRLYKIGENNEDIFNSNSKNINPNVFIFLFLVALLSISGIYIITTRHNAPSQNTFYSVKHLNKSETNSPKQNTLSTPELQNGQKLTKVGNMLELVKPWYKGIIKNGKNTYKLEFLQGTKYSRTSKMLETSMVSPAYISILIWRREQNNKWHLIDKQVNLMTSGVGGEASPITHPGIHTPYHDPSSAPILTLDGGYSNVFDDNATFIFVPYGGMTQGYVTINYHILTFDGNSIDKAGNFLYVYDDSGAVDPNMKFSPNLIKFKANIKIGQSSSNGLKNLIVTYKGLLPKSIGKKTYAVKYSYNGSKYVSDNPPINILFNLY